MAARRHSIYWCVSVKCPCTDRESSRVLISSRRGVPSSNLWLNRSRVSSSPLVLWSRRRISRSRTASSDSHGMADAGHPDGSTRPHQAYWTLSPRVCSWSWRRCFVPLSSVLLSLRYCSHHVPGIVTMKCVYLDHCSREYSMLHSATKARNPGLPPMACLPVLRLECNVLHPFQYIPFIAGRYHTTNRPLRTVSYR